jgi:predicted alpha/beta hydrolase family esterase
METIRLIVEKVFLGDEVAYRVWSPDCSGLGIIAKTDEEAVTLAKGAVAEFRKARGQHLPFRMTTLRSANDHSDRIASGSRHPHQ